MQAHEDQLSRRCQLTLFRASRGLERAIDRVERIADACWSDIEAQCGNAERVGQCLVQKSGSLSQACQTVLTGLRQAVQGVASLRGMPVYSSDDKNLGQVVEITRDPDGKVQAIEIAVGRWLGIGDRTITISADEFERLGDRIKLRLARRGDPCHAGVEEQVALPGGQCDAGRPPLPERPSLTGRRRGLAPAHPLPSAPPRRWCRGR